MTTRTATRNVPTTATGGARSIQVAAIDEKLAYLVEAVSEVKSQVGSLALDVRRFREEYLREHVRLVEQVSAAQRRIDELENAMQRLDRKIDELDLRVQPLIFQARLLGFLGGAVGVLLVGLIWAILTHQVEILP